MSPQLQAKLLRITQDGRFQRVGSNTEIHANARILAATNRQLEAEVKNGRFREDLYYRLNVVELIVPALRERPEDILPLARQFMAEMTQGKARFSPAVVDCLQRYNWPGNVRELRNAMERAALLSQGELILVDHLPARLRASGPSPAPAAAPPGSDALRLEELERNRHHPGVAHEPVQPHGNRQGPGDQSADPWSTSFSACASWVFEIDAR